MTPQPQAPGLGSRTSLLVPLAAGVAAFAVQMLWIRRYYVSVPFWDEWNSLYGFLAAWHAGAVTWYGFWVQHMEHRIPVARVYFILIDVIFGEGSQLGLLTGHAVLLAGIVMLWVYALRRLGEPLWLVAATLVIVVSPAQHENWTWGFQVEFFTLVGAVLAAVCWIALAPRLTWAGVAGCAIACTVGSYSIASGLSSWAAIGLLLALRVCLERGWSPGGLLHARRETGQLLMFLAAGIFVTATYLYSYQAMSPREALAPSLAAVVQWMAAALVFPLIDARLPGELRWLPVTVVFVLAPIAAALVLHVRRDDRARLLLTTGVLLMVAGNAGIMAVGRGGWIFVASRYGTVLLWTGAVALLSIATLLRAIPERRRWAAVPIGLAGAILVGLHLWRYLTFLPNMEEFRNTKLTWQDSMRAYLSDDSPDRQLAASTPFPVEPIARLLHRRQFLATLPYNLRPPARVRTSGDAWTLDRVSKAGVAPEYFTWRSSSGAAARTGTLTSMPFSAPAGLTLRVSGYPTRRGNSLTIESAADPSVRTVYTGPDPGDAWIEWRVDLARFRGAFIRVVAIDGREADGAWLGLAFPADRPAAVHVLETLVRHVGTLAMALLALISGWAWKNRRAPVRA